MEEESYILTPGWRPDPGYDAAQAYLEAADHVFNLQSAKTGWLEFPNWFVVHHLSVIAVELYMKSSRVTVHHLPAVDESGTDDLRYTHAYAGHNFQEEKLSPEFVANLESKLPTNLWQLLKKVTEPRVAGEEIAKGRYPYEPLKNGNPYGQAFPHGEEGKALANDWLNLAKALSELC